VFSWNKFLEDVAQASQGDFPTGFKLLGSVLYIAGCGPESLLSGNMISPRTYYRWVETLKAAGWVSLLAKARVRQALSEYANTLLEYRGAELPEVRQTLVAAIETVIASASTTASPPYGSQSRSLSPQSILHGGSLVVKGGAAGSEATLPLTSKVPCDNAEGESDRPQVGTCGMLGRPSSGVYRS
jgi:hypothetical protein